MNYAQGLPGNLSSATGAAPQRSVDAAVQNMNNTIAELLELIRNLEQGLSAILSPSAPTASKDQSSKPPSGVKLTDTLNQLNNNVSIACSILRDMSSRIEVS